MSRVEQHNSAEFNEHLWNDLTDYHARVVAFLREVINPVLFTPDAITPGENLNLNKNL